MSSDLAEASGSSSGCNTGSARPSAPNERPLDGRVLELLSRGRECSADELCELEGLLGSKTKKELVAYAKHHNVKVTQSSTKAVFIGRLLSYCRIGLTSRSRSADAGEDDEAESGGVLLTDHERLALEALPSLSDVKDGWTKDCGALKSFGFLHIYAYLVESRDNTFDQQKKEAYKSLKGYRYHADDLVRNVWCRTFLAKEQDETVLYFKAHVHASWTVGTSYDVLTRLITSSGSVADGSCTCVAGRGGTCSHVAALLFYVLSLAEKHATKVPADVTATGRQCAWSRAPKRNVEPTEVASIAFKKAEYAKHDRPTRSLEGFDPRQPEHRIPNVGGKETLLQRMEKNSPRSGLLYFHDRVRLAPGMADYDNRVARDFVLLDASSPAPETAECMDGLPLDHPVVKETVLATYPDFTCTAEQAACVERLTRQQADSSLWHALHSGRITSSSFSKVARRLSTTAPDVLVRDLMGYKQRHLTTAAITWGKKHEDIARKAYIAEVRRQGHPALSVSPSGLNLMNSATYLAASTDGKVVDPSHSPPEGVLEIKCPYSIDGERITDLSPSTITSRYGSKFYLREHEDGELALDSRSHYYAQVQGEMGVCGLEWCDFVVWTEGGLFVERILFDADYWTNLSSSLEAFFSVICCLSLCCDVSSVN